mmetsp:Transcript_25594/g.60515  ORF Transcript_25594/g.60515 Transcript_25594/m.60515 type:complete len:125 (-) Transcript_25594:300-674(-)
MLDILIALPNPHSIQKIEFILYPTNTHKLTARQLLLEVLPRFPNLHDLCFYGGCLVDSLVPIAESINSTTARNNLRVGIRLKCLSSDTLGMKLQDDGNSDNQLRHWRSDIISTPKNPVSNRHEP